MTLTERSIAMKRIKAAVLDQLVHFQLKEGDTSEAAKYAVQLELKKYKETLDRTGAKYLILGEENQPDGSVILHIKKQNGSQPVGSFLK